MTGMLPNLARVLGSAAGAAKNATSGTSSSSSASSSSSSGMTGGSAWAEALPQFLKNRFSEPGGGIDPWEQDDALQERQLQRSFDLLEVMERGLAKEVPDNFLDPIRRGSRLHRHHVIRSEDKLEYKLFNDDGDFLIFAKACLEQHSVNFFLYNPDAGGGGKEPLFDASFPTFTMSFSKDKKVWQLRNEVCEACRLSPCRRRACLLKGKQAVAYIAQGQVEIGDGLFNHMEIAIPGIWSDGNRVIWCKELGFGELCLNPADPHLLQLMTKQPEWNDEVESLVLDFKGRSIVASAKNYQLALAKKPDHIICQYGKIGAQTFSLDFKYPLSTVQAFAISLSTMFWV